MIGFYAGGAMGQSGGGGSGDPPDSFAGLTFWYDGDNSPQWKGSSTSSGASASNGDSMQRADSVPATIPICFSGAAGSRLVPIHSSSNGFRKVSSAGNSFYPRPVGTGNPSGALQASSLFTSTEKVIIAAVRVNNAPGVAGQPYGNPAVVGDASLYMGLHYYAAGSDLVFLAYNYPGANTVAPATIVNGIGEFVVVTYKHAGGNILIRVNGAQVGSAVASGATGVMTGTIQQGKGTGVPSIDTAQLATYNVDVADSDILKVERWMGAKVGVSI